MSAHPAASADVLVVGGGPTGARSALELARHGHDVLVVERRRPAPVVTSRHPSDRGDRPRRWSPVLTATAALDDAGIDIPRHPVSQMRVTTRSNSTTTTWPDVARSATVDLDAVRERLLAAAEDAGARILRGHEASGPIVERGFVRGASVSDPSDVTFEARARFTLVADGADSNFGRALGTTRAAQWPYALARTRVFTSAVGRASEAELVVDLEDRSGTPVTGFGWMYPSGSDHVGVGVLVWSTSPSFRVLRLPALLDQLIGRQHDAWQLTGSPIGPGRSGRLPLGNSVGPISGPTYLVAGDAAGAASPWSGAGVEAAFTTGALAAEVLHRAIETDATALQEFPKLVADRLETHYRIGRLAARLAGTPAVSTRLAHWASRHRPISEALTTVAAAPAALHQNTLAGTAYRIGRVMSSFAPDAER